MTIDPSTSGDNATPPPDRLDAAARAISIGHNLCDALAKVLRELRATQSELQLSEAAWLANRKMRDSQEKRAVEAERRLAAAEWVLANPQAAQCRHGNDHERVLMTHDMGGLDVPIILCEDCEHVCNGIHGHDVTLLNEALLTAYRARLAGEGAGDE